MTILPVRAILRPLAAAALLMTLLAPTAAVHADDVQADDGWRRTAYGWERIEDWHAPLVSRGGVSDHYAPPLPTADAPRCDLHPAVLLVLQLLGVGIALVVAPAVKTRSPASLKREIV